MSLRDSRFEIQKIMLPIVPSCEFSIKGKSKAEDKETWDCLNVLVKGFRSFFWLIFRFA